MHADEPVETANKPAAQGVQTRAFPIENVPIGQYSQVLPVKYVPGVVQVFAQYEIQFAFPEFPPAQDKQAVAPVAALAS